MSETFFDLVSFAAIHHLEVGDYAPLREQYRLDVWTAVQDFLYTEEGAKITRFRNAFKRAVLNAFFPAFEQGYQDGGSELPIEPDDSDWINAQQDAEFGYIDKLFQDLKALKKQSLVEGIGILEGVADARAAGYAKGLDGIYNQGRVRGAKNRMLTFGGEDGQESCSTCQRMKGQRHKASWWVKHGLVPGRGNDAFECGGWNCRHFLFDDAGDVFTV